VGDASRLASRFQSPEGMRRHLTCITSGSNAPEVGIESGRSRASLVWLHNRITGFQTLLRICYHESDGNGLV
jgi:hypothetical protein